MKKKMMKRLSVILALTTIIMTFGMSYASAAENSGFINEVISSNLFFVQAEKSTRQI